MSLAVQRHLAATRALHGLGVDAMRLPHHHSSRVEQRDGQGLDVARVGAR